MRIVQKSFASGELGSSLRGQSDSDIFRQGSPSFKNGTIGRAGEPFKRLGSEYKSTSLSTTGGALVDVHIDEIGRFVLEFGEGIVRAWIDGVMSIASTTSPYTLQQAQEAHYTQTPDTLFMTHNALDTQVVTFTPSTITFRNLGDAGVAPTIGLDLKQAELSKLSGTTRLESSVDTLFNSSDVQTDSVSPDTDEYHKASFWRVDGLDFLITTAIDFSPEEVECQKASFDVSTSAFSFPADKNWCGPWIYDSGTMPAENNAGPLGSSSSPQFVVRDFESGSVAIGDNLSREKVHEIIAVENRTSVNWDNAGQIGYFEPYHIGTVMTIGYTNNNARTTPRVLILGLAGTLQGNGKWSSAFCMLVSGEGGTHIKHGIVYVNKSHHAYLKDRESENLGSTNQIALSINDDTANEAGVLLSASHANVATSDPTTLEAKIFTQSDIDNNVTVNLNGGQVTITGFGPGYPGGGVPWYCVYVTVGAAGLDHFGTTVAWSKSGLGVSYASTCTMHQERLVLGGFSGDPDALALSRSGLPTNFNVGASDDDAMVINVRDDKGGAVKWLASMQDLVVGTENSEFVIKGTPITPTSIGADRQGTSGSSGVQPVLAGGSALFVNRTGTELREIGFRFERDRYTPLTLTNLNPELFQGNPITQLVMLRDPDPMVIALRTDGSLCALSYRKEASVVGWSPWTGTGEPVFKSILAVRRTGLDDQLWAIVERTDSAGVKTMRIETFDTGMKLDSSVSVTTGMPLTGQVTVASLASQTVHMMADGVYHGTKVLDATGSFDLGTLTVNTELSLGLEIPFELKMQTLAENDRHGDQASRVKNVRKGYVLLDKSAGGKLNGKGKLGNYTVGTAHTLSSNWELGETAHHNKGEEATVTITQTEPFPFRVLAVAVDVRLED